MNSTSLQPRRHLLDGATRVFLAEALIFPSGLIIVMFLTRKLGPEGYGHFTLAAVIVTWFEVIIASIFSRATIKFVSETEDWRSVGNIAIRLHLVISVAGALLLFIFADAVAGLLSEPKLTTYLRLFAFDIPLFSLTGALRDVLIGKGGFRQRALLTAAQCLTRLILVLLLVQLGLSVPGAILGSMGASLVGLIIGRYYINISPFSRSVFPARQLFSYAVWLFLYSISIIIYNKLDLLMFKILGGTADQAGIYGAAQSLAIIPAIFSLSFTPLLLSTLSRMLREGDDRGARELGRDAMRIVIWMLPFAGMTAGASSEIVVLIFGQPFQSAAPLLTLLIFAALFMLMISMASAILTAAGKPVWTFALTGPLLPLALVGHLALIPRLGALGASLTNSLFAFLGAGAGVLAVFSIWRILPPLMTLARSIFICGVAFAVAALWPTPGFLLLLKLPIVVFFIIAAFKISGEFSAADIALVRSILRRQPVIKPGQNPGQDPEA